MYPLIPTVYRALLKSAVSETNHRIHTTKKAPDQKLITGFIPLRKHLSGTDHRVHTTKKAPDLQAVPSGSGRLSLGALQDQQQSFAVSHATHPSGKALITAALSKTGFTMRSGKVSQQHKVVCVSQTGHAL